MEWIKTSDKFPNSNEMCLVILENRKDIDVLWWDDYYQCWNDFSNDDNACEALDVEYWMAMPELPKRSEG